MKREHGKEKDEAERNTVVKSARFGEGTVEAFVNCVDDSTTDFVSVPKFLSCEDALLPRRTKARSSPMTSTHSMRASCSVRWFRRQL